jgi:4-aminobutyrate aminotransferase-like enzyme
MPGVAFAPAPYCYRCPFKLYNQEKCNNACAEYLEDVIKYQTSENVAFFIAEPMLGEGGIIVPPSDYFTTIKMILDHYGILFIDDEVQTGFGRTGEMFAIQHYGVVPDIMVMGKGIADGFPLSCFIAPDEIADSFKVGDHLSTFGGNPVSCAASLANISFLEREKIPQTASIKGDSLRRMIKKINPNGVNIGDVRGRGLMTGVELVEDTKSKMPATQEAAKIRETLRHKGVMVGVGGVYGNVIRIQPPLVITDEEIEMFIERFKGVLENE